MPLLASFGVPEVFCRSKRKLSELKPRVAAFIGTGRDLEWFANFHFFSISTSTRNFMGLLFFRAYAMRGSLSRDLRRFIIHHTNSWDRIAPWYREKNCISYIFYSSNRNNEFALFRSTKLLSRMYENVFSAVYAPPWFTITIDCNSPMQGKGRQRQVSPAHYAPIFNN